MSDVSSVTKHFAKPQEGFTTTLASTISAGATTVPMNSVTGLTDGDVFVGIMDPGATAEQVFTGDVDTSGVQITNVKWTKGTNTTHNAGTTIVDYTTATAFSMMSKGVLVHADQDGTLKANSVDTAAITDSAVTSAKLSSGVKTGWNDVPGTTSYNQNNGARSTDIDVDSDITASVDEGMRVRMTRGTTPPTQSYDFEESSSHYANKTSPVGITFTDDFTIEAWIKVESSDADSIVLSRFDGTSGWRVKLNSANQIEIVGFNAGGGNFRQVITGGGDFPVGEWTHIAATLDMSGWTTATNTVFVNGVSRSVTLNSSGTNPTSLVQAGDLELGSVNSGTNFFDGKIAMVRVWSDIRTEDEIQDNMSIETPAVTTNLVDQWSLDGDLTSWSGSNDLTAQGGVAAATDNPFRSTEYGVISNVSEAGGTTTLTVDTNIENYVVPNDTLNNVQYSSHLAPQGAGAIAEKQWFTNPYCFRAVKDADQNVTDSSFTKITLAIVEYDYNGDFASSTYTVPVSGVYHFNGRVRHTNTTVSPVLAFLSIYQNGVDRIRGHNMPGSASAALAWTISDDLYCEAGDTIELYHYQDSAGTEVMDATQTYFSGHLVHAT